MTLLKTLAVAIDVAHLKRDEASRALGQAQQKYLGAKNQLEQLETYATETEDRWMVQAQNCALPEMMRHHYQFMERLAQAIQMQQGILADQARWVDVAKKQLADAEIRVATLKQVCRNKQLEADRLQSRREQKQIDEFAALRFGKSIDQQFGEGVS
ncbi:flagellar FliJ protein [Rhodoferax ferrireducens]|uniref:Flagellar FliJ protein n=1 Tax=Rhodoferax ferrireducens TaxID=192843 RepID=A0ABU2CDZ0_9BURK|nr:flagellar export protein FliJ [Rhodoferax ferrireducens]MDR7379534.1 flagellar FliJ protein [Rhodoferax ferrireducens]